MEQYPAKAKSKILSLNVFVPVVGLIYPVIFLVALTIESVITTGSVPGFLVVFIPILIVFTVLAAGVWRQSRVAYIGTASFTGFFIVVGYVLNWDHGIGVFANPSGTVEFVFVVTSLPGLIGAFAYSILGYREVKRRRVRGAETVAPVHTIPRSSIVALILLGFVTGGLVVGLFAGATQTRLLAVAGTHADITIAVGAGSSTNSQFYVPSSFTVKVGDTVTWVNGDTTVHKVTSSTGLFNSGSLQSGENYKFTFSQPGTYQYYCTFHGWMKGTIVVVSG